MGSFQVHPSLGISGGVGRWVVQWPIESSFQDSFWVSLPSPGETHVTSFGSEQVQVQVHGVCVCVHGVCVCVCARARVRVRVRVCVHGMCAYVLVYWRYVCDLFRPRDLN